MAQAGVVLDRDQFNCSICLEVLKHPVTIPCGHSYCLHCIQNYWDQDDFRGVFVCPQCRQSFSPRPVLARNTMLDDVVDKFKKTSLHNASTLENKQSFAEADDVECDVCTGRKNKAVKSCLVCLASYCELHVQPHFESAAFKKHKLVSANKRLQETICARHDKLLEVYCRSDRRFICYLCLTDEHKGHDTVLVEEETQNMQRQLGDIKQRSQTEIQKREKEAQELRLSIMFFSRSARATAEKADAIFTELIRSMELKHFEVRELIKAQEKTAIREAEQLLEKMQKEIVELKKSDTEVDQLALIEDPVHFLQSCQSLQAPPALSASPLLSTNPGGSFDPVMAAVADFKELLHEVSEVGFASIFEKVREVQIIGPQNPPVQSDGETGSAAQTDPPVVLAAAIPFGLDQTSANPLNPFLIPGPTAPMFSLSPLGSRLSSGTRHRHVQRRPHPRRK
uniref:FinTRIM family, member 67 n=1 Tax=Nothobranchius kuhntae TaxID=321403 RepID=A0A1A8KYB1_NOTKU